MRKTEHLIPFNPKAADRRTNARIDAAVNARTLEHATIGRDGLDVIDAGRIRLRGGGGVDVYDDGSLRAYYSSGTAAVQFGPVDYTWATPMYGLLVQLDNGDPDDPTSGADAIRMGVATDIGRGFCLFGVNNTPLRSFAAVADQIILTTPETTTDPVNVNVGVDGHVRLVTSVAASKVDVTDLALDADAIRALRSRTWIDLGARERGEPDRRVAGLVREEVAEAAAEHPELTPLLLPGDGLAYDRLAVLHQPVIVDHDDRIAALEAELAETRAQLTALAAAVAALTPKEG